VNHLFLLERAYFLLCLSFGRLLRSATYSAADVVGEHVRKRRRFYAPLLVSMGAPLSRILDTGVLVLPQREWEEREREIYNTVHGSSIRVDDVGTLVLPRLAGQTLASLLEEPALTESSRTRAIGHAVVALADFHERGFTHGDAMAENVLVDLEGGKAHWIDFETIHDSKRPMAWRRADDLRALLATCLLRVDRAKLAETLELILDAYGNEEIARRLVPSFASALRRPLIFHLGQAGLSFRRFRDIDRLLREFLPSDPLDSVKRSVYFAP
jgi:serine/threonine protein kinase